MKEDGENGQEKLKIWRCGRLLDMLLVWIKLLEFVREVLEYGRMSRKFARAVDARYGKNIKLWLNRHQCYRISISTTEDRHFVVDVVSTDIYCFIKASNSLL